MILIGEKIMAHQAGMIQFKVRGKALKAVKVTSGTFTTSLDDVDYNITEGIFTANSSGTADVTLNLREDKAYLLWAVDADEEVPNIQKIVSKIKPTVSTTKTSKGIKVNLKTKGGNVTDIKANGYTLQYKIYRAVKKNGKYALKKTTTAKSYTDTSVKKGKKYYYKVRMYVKDASGTVVKTTSLSKSNVAARTY